MTDYERKLKDALTELGLTVQWFGPPADRWWSASRLRADGVVFRMSARRHQVTELAASGPVGKISSLVSSILRVLATLQ